MKLYVYSFYCHRSPRELLNFFSTPSILLFMSRDYKPMPPLWRIKEVVALSDESPSGLIYVKKNKPVKRLHKHSGYYLVSIDADVYQAHRIVYYLRTGECPDHCCISHQDKNKDNRQELYKSWIARPHKRKKTWSWDD